jgi:hypothetical protein
MNFKNQTEIPWSGLSFHQKLLAENYVEDNH